MEFLLYGLLFLLLASSIWLSYTKTEIENQLRLLQLENQKLKESELALADANVKMAQLYLEIEESRNELKKSYEVLQTKQAELATALSELEQTRDNLIRINQLLKESEKNLEEKVQTRTKELLKAKEEAEIANKV
ncbi:MAG: hypothetical protein NZ108_00620, partial [Bacteroidia bacterium]|nr:hypothetical protein [Bacteroidia bacterium]